MKKLLTYGRLLEASLPGRLAVHCRGYESGFCGLQHPRGILSEWRGSCTYPRMSTSTVSPEELLEKATELAKSGSNLDMMDRITMLRGYLGLRTLDPQNGSYRQNVEDAVASLLQGAHQNAHFHILIPY